MSRNGPRGSSMPPAPRRHNRNPRHNHRPGDLFQLLVNRDRTLPLAKRHAADPRWPMPNRIIAFANNTSCRREMRGDSQASSKRSSEGQPRSSSSAPRSPMKRALGANAIASRDSVVDALEMLEATRRIVGPAVQPQPREPVTADRGAAQLGCLRTSFLDQQHLRRCDGMGHASMIHPGVRYGIGPMYKVHMTGCATRVGALKDEWATRRNAARLCLTAYVRLHRRPLSQPLGVQSSRAPWRRREQWGCESERRRLAHRGNPAIAV